MKKIALILLLLFSVGYCAAQDSAKDYSSTDTIAIELCYSYTDCMVKDTTFEGIYNSHCLKFEKGYVLHGLDRDIFFDDNKKLFAKTIVIWFWNEVGKKKE